MPDAGFLTDDSSLERGLVGDSVEVGVGVEVVVLLEVGIETAEVDEVFAFGVGALQAYRRKPD